VQYRCFMILRYIDLMFSSYHTSVYNLAVIILQASVVQDS